MWKIFTLSNLILVNTRNTLDEHPTDTMRMSYFNKDLRTLSVDICSLEKLEFLELVDCQIVEIPTEFGNLSNLAHLKLFNNKLTQLPDQFCNLTLLKILDLGSNQLTHLPENFCNLKNLKILRLNSNQLKNMPSGFEKLEDLEILDISNNHFDVFPSEIIKLTKLKELYIDGNQWKELPAEISNLNDLKILSIRNSKATIPDEIYKLINLKKLDLSDNGLSKISSKIENLKNLRYLYLCNNNLKTLPGSIRSLNLCGLNIKGNRYFLDDGNDGELGINDLIRILPEDPIIKNISENYREYYTRFLYDQERIKTEIPLLNNEIPSLNKPSNRAVIRRKYIPVKLSWNLDIIGKLKININETTLDKKGMIEIIKKAAKTPVCEHNSSSTDLKSDLIESTMCILSIFNTDDFKNSTLIDQKDSEVLIKYVNSLYRNKKQPVPVKYIPMMKNILGCVLEHINQAIETNNVDSLKYSISKISQSTKSPIELIIELRKACLTFADLLSSDLADLDSFIFKKLTFLKEKFFNNEISKSINEYELENILSLQSDEEYSNSINQIKKNLFKSFFTPEYVCDLLTIEINRNDSLLNSLKEIINKDSSLKEKDELIAKESGKIRSKAVEYILLKKGIIYKNN